MTILATSLRRFHSSSELAKLLTQPAMFEISTHSVEQTISTVRRKLGEAGREQRVLISRRGLGYALVPNGRFSNANTARQTMSATATGVRLSSRI